MQLRKFVSSLVLMLVLFLGLTAFAPVASASGAEDGVIFAQLLAEQTMAAAAQDEYHCIWENLGWSFCVSEYAANFTYDARLRQVFRHYWDVELSIYSGQYAWNSAPVACEARFTSFPIWGNNGWETDWDAVNACVIEVEADRALLAF